MTVQERKKYVVGHQEGHRNVIGNTNGKIKELKPTNSLIREIHDFLLPIVSGVESVETVARFQRACGIEKDGRISNRTLYVFFRFASTAGEEIFSLMPVLFWVCFPVAIPFITNFNVMLVTGQLIKDFLMLPRPVSKAGSKNPIVKVGDAHFETEFGLPSTHTMSGMLPAVVLLGLVRHGVDVSIQSWAYSLLYTVAVAMSRLYLGVHSVYDVLAGALIGYVIIYTLHIYGDIIDQVLYVNPFGILLTLASMVAFLTIYPRSGPWSAGYGTSCQIYGSWAGIATCLWYILHCNTFLRDVLYQTSLVQPREMLTNYKPVFNTAGDFLHQYIPGMSAPAWNIIYSSYEPDQSAEVNAATIAVRIVASFALVGVGKLVGKAIPSLVFNMLQKRGIVAHRPEENFDRLGQAVPAHKHYCVEVPVRLINYAVVAWCSLVFAPMLWRYLPVFI